MSPLFVVRIPAVQSKGKQQPESAPFRRLRQVSKSCKTQLDCREDISGPLLSVLSLCLWTLSIFSPQSSPTDVLSWPSHTPRHETAHNKTHALSQASLQQNITCPLTRQLLAKHDVTQLSLQKKKLPLKRPMHFSTCLVGSSVNPWDSQVVVNNTTSPAFRLKT